MRFQNWTDGNRSVGAAAILAVVLVIAGCASRKTTRMADLPGEQRLVGGGLSINWQAPEDGTVYLVEKRTGKLIETQSMREGEMYIFAIETVVDASDMESLIGIDVSRAEFLLYFEPAGSGFAAG